MQLQTNIFMDTVVCNNFKWEKISIFIQYDDKSKQDNLCS